MGSSTAAFTYDWLCVLLIDIIAICMIKFAGLRVSNQLHSYIQVKDHLRALRLSKPKGVMRLYLL
jgi:hypothetical protein